MTAEMENNMEEPKPLSTKQDVLDFVLSPDNVDDVKYGRICGDGRYSETRGKLARFGADGGYVLGLLSLNRSMDLGLTPEQIVDAVVAVSIKDGEKFSIHTDGHEGDEPYSIGCGHLGKASLTENEAKYEVDADDVRQSIIYIKGLAKTHPEKVEIEKLEGDHAEKGVIFNTGKKKKINHRKGDKQWFVVATKRDEDYIENVLFPRLINELPVLAERNIDVEDYKKILAKQTGTTAEILAKGYPIYEANVDGANPYVEQVGVV